MSKETCTECNGYGQIKAKAAYDSHAGTNAGTRKVSIECINCNGAGHIETVEGIEQSDIELLRDIATFLDGYIVGKGSSTMGDEHIDALRNVYVSLSEGVEDE